MKPRAPQLFVRPLLATCMGMVMFMGLGLITAGRVEAQSSCVPPPPGLTAWFPLQNYVTDIIGGVQPMATNAISFVPGEVGQGVSLGTGGFIDLATNHVAWENPHFTWEAWVRWDGAGPNEDFAGSCILENCTNGVSGYALCARASDKRFVFVCASNGSSNGSLIVAANTFTPGVFYHVAGSCDGTNFNLYVNGTLQGQLTSDVPLSWGPYWTIGCNPAFARAAGVSRTWNGVIDEVSIYNRALTATEIQAIYHAGNAGKCLVQLAIIPAGTNALLTWPTNFNGYTLQSTTNLNVNPAALAAWTYVSTVPAIIATNNVVTNTISGPQKFFRLANP